MMQTLESERLLLRPFRAADAAAVCALCGNWKVARMLARVPHPLTHDLAAQWIASHGPNRRSGDEIIFCIERNLEVIGSVGLRRTAAQTYNLGYWLGEPWWGQGFATEAAGMAVRFAFDRLDTEKLTSGHFHDNLASGHVLEKCGCRYIGESIMHCEARGGALAHNDFAYCRNELYSRAERP